MGYTDIFGGALLFPSQLSYLSITTAVDLTLQWPLEQQVGGDAIVADFLDIDATVASINIDMPIATATGTGNKTTFNNIGANTFTVRDSTGGTIQSVAPGEAWVIVLRDNTTAAGLWRTFQLGASVSVASASALAGAGIKAIGALLNQQIDSDVEAVTPFTVVEGDRANCSIYTAGAGTCNLPSAGAVGNDWFFMLRNSGSGTLNIVPPAGVIDGAASINLDPNDSAFIFTDGTDFFTVGLSSGSTIAFDFVSIPVPGSGDFVLSGANLNRIAYRFTGALTGNRRIVVPNTTQQYWVDNQTTGAFTLEVSTVAQVTPPAVTQGQTIILYCDGTDVVNAVSSSAIVFPVTIGQGGTGATTVAAAQVNLQVPPVGRLIDTTAPLSGGGDLSGDRTLVVAAASEGGSGVAEIATQAEADAGADDLRIITPAKLAAAVTALLSNNDLRRKDVSTSRTSTTTPTDDPALVGWSLDANQNYLIEGFLLLTNLSGVPGFRSIFQYSGALVSGSRIGYIYIDSGFLTQTLTQVPETLIIITIPSGNERMIMFRGIIRTSTAGTLDFQWAQGVSSGDFTALQDGSWINIQNTGLGSVGTSNNFLS